MKWKKKKKENQSKIVAINAEYCRDEHDRMCTFYVL